MNDPLQPSTAKWTNRLPPPLVGLLVGGGVGAFARFGVALAFVFYVKNWGEGYWKQGGPDYGVAFISALAGCAIGGLAGVTCRPVLGVLLGGFLSAGFCLAFAVIPEFALLEFESNFSIFGSKPGPPATQEKREILFGWIAMTIAGALAGGIGATAGKWSRRVLCKDVPE